MKILMLTGSPHKKGTTSRLADAFIKGAETAGHTVERFDTAFMDISPCNACYHCRKHDGICTKKDDMTPLLGDEGLILSSDVIVFVTPLYYFGMSAQLKAALDRFYAISKKTRDKNQKAFLLSAAGDDGEDVMAALKSQFEILCQWTHWENGGSVLALHCHEPKDLDGTSYEQEAYRLGANI